jgi:hypothetical protein
MELLPPKPAMLARRLQHTEIGYDAVAFDAYGERLSACCRGDRGVDRLRYRRSKLTKRFGLRMGLKV